MKFHKNKIIKGFVLLFLLIMIAFPGASFEGASSGLLLWFHNVLPNLLPFIILSNLMIRLNLARQISRFFYPIFGRLFHVSMEGCYPIIMGFLSGIPMGAKSTADLVSEQRIHRQEGQFLLGMCNNASPMFIIGYITITQLQLPQIKYALFVIIYGSAILGTIFYRMIYRTIRRQQVTESELSNLHNQKVSSRFSFELLDSSIMNGFEVVTRIGGYIILFSIIAQIIKSIGPNFQLVKAVLMGVVEITTGINQICKTNLNSEIKIVLIAVITSFGGFSGIAQTKSVLGNSRLSIKSYIIIKLFSAALALLLALLYVLLLYQG